MQTATIAVSAIQESSKATGIDGDQTDDSAERAGAVYVFSRTAGGIVQSAYVKASNTDALDFFGLSVALSGDGNLLAVGAHGEAGFSAGLSGRQDDNSAPRAGAVYPY